MFNKQTGFNYETRIGTGTAVSTTSPDSWNVAESRDQDNADSRHDLRRSTCRCLPNAPFNRADRAVRAPSAQSFYAPRRYQLTARITF
jgi:hypothetical protein